ncbi:restriction endonuclease [Vandammella animalimorsus]|uniref:Restriction endonuclease n=1 Tax=Vandammella animalimorsus TaxID=2029117 RepID=A0A2A2ALS1_9BURK|nr:DEAD/DEAH box helicase family protein [Vandammella animalimorsus]PAT39520.1 restriction endonuclease [Vandammella animalimorsus]
MSEQFFQQPILNSPYAYPARHWALDEAGQPTGQVIDSRRRADFITPIPRPRKARGAQSELALGSQHGSDNQLYHRDLINAVRQEVDAWRKLPPSQWRVTSETARLLQHWRAHEFSGVRPFFCQIEAAETAIWLTEVAPQLGQRGQPFLDHLARASQDANPGLMRLALKLATGAGKTTVMAMLIAWQTVNAVRHPRNKKFTRGFLLVAPGLTIRDRLRVLLPNDPDSYYASREIVPRDMLADLDRAKIVITNYHAFKRRERMELSKGGRRLLQGRTGSAPDTLETEGQMLQRVMPALMGMKNILVLNDEAHHCYREKPASDDDFIDDKGNLLTGDDLKAAKEHAKSENEAARLWIAGLETVQRHLGVQRVIDLSATPFFLAGSGYAEGTLFPWTMSDFSLMDAIECGIVKLPRVPVVDNIPGSDMPIYRELWKHIGKKMPKKGRGKGGALDPHAIPVELQTALEALYGHYVQTFEAWKKAGIRVPPCFIVVCNNTATSKLVYDYIAGFERTDDEGNITRIPGRLELFRNFDDYGEPLARPNTLLIDSEQLESGEALDDNFRRMAGDEIERFRREIIERTGDRTRADDLSDQDLLREVMNTVGKPGRLGESIRCVVSVSMLTEGWDANTVTHILGVRAFGTQLLCEQVIGRALRRQSYELNAQGRFDVEYADVFGIPFDFTAKPVVTAPPTPRETVIVKALRPERDHLEIRFPRVLGYRVERPQAGLQARFGDEHHMTLTPEMVGPTQTQNAGIIGEAVNLTVQHLGDVRQSTLLMELTRHLIQHWREPGQPPPIHLFGQLKRIARQWLDECLHCKGDTYPAQLMYRALADKACQKITAAITREALEKGAQVKAILDPYNPTGSTAHVRFATARDTRWETLGPPPKNHVNWVVTDSDWEAEFCRVAEQHPRVIAYTKNHNLGLEAPYQFGGDNRLYRPDFIVLVDDGHGADDPLHLIVEIKGYRREDADFKKAAMQSHWLPAVNQLGAHGRWAFAEFGDVYEMQSDFAQKVQEHFEAMLKASVKADQ